MNTILSTTLALTLIGGLIACDAESRDAAHDAVDAVSDRVQETRQDVRRTLEASGVDIDRLREHLDDKAQEVSDKSREAYRATLESLEAQREALDASFEEAWNGGAQALSAWEQKADELRDRTAAAWEAFQEAEPKGD